jgi:hypothetical protein
VPKLGSGKIDRAAVRALIDAPVAVTATPS